MAGRSRGKLLQSPDMEGFRQWLLKNKETRLVNKLMSEKEAVSRFVHDGDYLGTELYGTVRAPLTIVREIVRQGKKQLRVAGQGLMDVDYLLAAGLIEAMDITYVAYEAYGLSPILRRAAEKKGLKLIEWSNGAMAWRFKAAAMGIPFLPARSMLGSDTFRWSAAKEMKCPFTGIKLALLPALILDCGIIHAHRADIYGNCQIDGISGFAPEMARASKRLIVSAEQIIDTEEIRRCPERTVIPYFLVDAVVHAPFGSHPGETCGLYKRDEAHFQRYLAAIKTEEGTKEYLKKFIYGPAGHDQYLDLIGREKLEALRVK
ncbi:MAG: CoA transferase subunit A [Elusimicrobia bacterium]|nr:CoA transferase subunit A [Elusimicrobiota bacterium]